MKYKITCESCADLNPEIYKKLKISVIPFPIHLGERTCHDGVDVTNPELFEFYDQTKQLAKTSALNVAEYQDFFEKELEDADGLIHFSVSSGLSSTYHNAVAAAKNLKNVYVIDSQSLCSGIGIQVMFATELRDRNVPIEEAVQRIVDRQKYLQLSFVMDKLFFMHKGGRCTGLTLLGANILSLKPAVQNKDGKIIVTRKYIGKIHKILDKYINDTLKEYNNPDLSLCILSYSTATEEMLAAARESLAKYNKFEKIIETFAGATISTHCGPNTLGIVYYNDGGYEFPEKTK